MITGLVSVLTVKLWCLWQAESLFSGVVLRGELKRAQERGVHMQTSN